MCKPNEQKECVYCYGEPAFHIDGRWYCSTECHTADYSVEHMCNRWHESGVCVDCGEKTLDFCDVVAGSDVDDM